MTRYYYYLEDGLYKKYKVEDPNKEEFDKLRKKVITYCSEYEDIKKQFPKTDDINLEREYNDSKPFKGNSEIINYQEKFHRNGLLGKKIESIKYTICTYPNLIRLIDGVNKDTYYSSEYFHTILTEDFTNEIITAKDKFLQELRLVDEIISKDEYISRKELINLKRLQNLYERNINQEDPRNYYKEAISLFPYEIVDELNEEYYQRYQEFFGESTKRRIRER